MMEAIAQQGPAMKAWFAWMFLVNISSLAFVKNQISSRWVFAAMIGNLIGMNVLVREFGPGPLNSIPHIVLWTPLLVYLTLVWNKTARKTVFWYWLSVLMLTDCASLILDYRVMTLYLLGGGE